MTISNVYAPLNYAGNGVTTAFSVTFPFYDNTLLVTAVDEDGVETVKTISTHYTVSGGTDSNGLASTGTVTMLVAPAADTVLRIERVTPKTQAITFATNDAFVAKVIEGAFDRNLMIIQEQAAVNDEITGDFLQLNTAGEIDYWDAETHVISNVSDAIAATDAPNLSQVEELISDAAMDNQLGETFFTQSGAGAEERSWLEKVREYPSVADFGTDAATAIPAMITAFGFVLFPAGSTAIANSISIDAPAYFAPGAYITIANTKIVTFEFPIHAGREEIFRGDGTVELSGPGGARTAFPEWWGCFPDDDTVDAGPLLQKLSDAIVGDSSGSANARECLVLVAPGSYYLETGVDWSRCCRVVGAGDRIVNFVLQSSFTTGDVFTAIEEGCQFEHFQMTAEALHTSGAFINLAGFTRHRVRNLVISGFEVGIEFSGTGVIVEDIESLGNAGTPDCTVKVTGGTDANIRRIRHLSSINKPDAIVRLVPSVGTITNCLVEDIESNRSARVVSAESTTNGNSIRQCTIKNVFGNGAEVTDAVAVTTSGTGTIDGMVIHDIRGTAIAGNGIELNNAGSGAFEGVHIGAHEFDGPGGDGVYVTDGGTRISLLTITAGDVRNGGAHGYNILATKFTISGIAADANTGTGLVLQSGCTFFKVIGPDLFNNGTNFDDSSSDATDKLILLSDQLWMSGLAPQVFWIDRTASAQAFSILVDGSTWKLQQESTGGTLTFDRDVMAVSSAGNLTLGVGLGVGVAASTAAFLKIAAGTTAKAQVNLPTSTAPTSPVDGDVWREDNTDTGLKVRINGATKTITVS
jgi:hypothetical protein